MSASSRPPAAPAWANATARLTLTVLLPTPPLPDATARMFFTPGTSCSDWRGWGRRPLRRHVVLLLGLARLGATDHRAPVDVDAGRPDRAERGMRRALDLVLQRAGGRRELDG